MPNTVLTFRDTYCGDQFLHSSFSQHFFTVSPFKHFYFSTSFLSQLMSSFLSCITYRFQYCSLLRFRININVNIWTIVFIKFLSSSVIFLSSAFKIVTLIWQSYRIYVYMNTCCFSWNHILAKDLESALQCKYPLIPSKTLNCLPKK